MARSLIVLPNDSAKPIIDAIGAARRSLRIKMFVFSDRTLLNAVVAAGRRGVKVQVMLNPARRSGERDNEHTRKLLERARVRVRDANPAFDLTHEKSMVVDDAAAFVKSFNWATKNLTETRDYAVVTTNPHDVGDVIDGFDADYSGWGKEDSDIIVRLLHAGVRRKDGRFATGVIHLWHPEADRGQLAANDARLDVVLGSDRARAQRGLTVLREAAELGEHDRQDGQHVPAQS